MIENLLLLKMYQNYAKSSHQKLYVLPFVSKFVTKNKLRQRMIVFSIAVRLLSSGLDILQNISEHVDNKTKGQTSKRVFQEKKSRQIFRKTNISYPLIRRQEIFVFL